VQQFEDADEREKCPDTLERMFGLAKGCNECKHTEDGDEHGKRRERGGLPVGPTLPPAANAHGEDITGEMVDVKVS
jgi:hypothetical protein